jgi:hypothetical protein
MSGIAGAAGGAKLGGPAGPLVTTGKAGGPNGDPTGGANGPGTPGGGAIG